jgi:hypothetical protein
MCNDKWFKKTSVVDPDPGRQKLPAKIEKS